jgi:hypothetical protein
MRTLLRASSCALAVLIAFSIRSNAQTALSDRCHVSLGVPQENLMAFRVQADSFDLTPPKGFPGPPQGLLVTSGNESGLPFKFVRGVYGPPVPDFLVVSPSRGVTPAWIWVGLNRDVVPYMGAGTYTAGLEFALQDEPDKICGNSYSLRSIILHVIGGPPPSRDVRGERRHAARGLLPWDGHLHFWNEPEHAADHGPV